MIARSIHVSHKLGCDLDMCFWSQAPPAENELQANTQKENDEEQGSHEEEDAEDAEPASSTTSKKKKQRRPLTRRATWPTLLANTPLKSITYQVMS